MADPICRWRNATPETVCELVHELPKKTMPKAEFRSLMEKSKFGKDFFRTAYQLARQLALYVETDTYVPRFSHDISIEEAKKYLIHWFSKYYVPNPYTKDGFNEVEKPVLIEQSFVEYLNKNNGNCDLEEAYKDIFHEDKIGELDIFTNAIRAYSTKIKINEREPLIIEGQKKKKQYSLELNGDYIKMNVNIDRNDEEGFFNSFNQTLQKGQKIPLPKNNARKCAKKIFEILWEEDNFDKLKPFIKDGVNPGIEHISIKDGTLANVFCTEKSSNYNNKTRTFQDTIYQFENNGQEYVSKLTTQWQGFNTEKANYTKGRTYLWALRDIVNISYADKFLIENEGEEAWITYLTESKDSEITPTEENGTFSDCYKDLIINNKDYYKRYIKSLIQKPFTILTGNSGTGKTKIALDLAKKLEKSFSDGTINSLVVQVGADWTDTSKILGFYNPLNKEYKKTSILEFIESANRHSNIPFFLILDEMNLSHVERYFSDFLSLMETPDLSFELDNYDSVSFPKNLYVTGTVNIDETTYMFSPKVLDRANVIEFKPTKESILKLLENDGEKDSITPANDGSAEAFFELSEKVRNATVKDYENIDFVNVKNVLDAFYVSLEKAGFEFAYRTVKEISHYLIASYELDGSDFKLEEAMDEQIVQKILPKIHGNKKQIGSLLFELEKLCLSKDEKQLRKNTDIEIVGTGSYNFKLSFEKLGEMQTKLNNTQYASFI